MIRIYCTVATLVVALLAANAAAVNILYDFEGDTDSATDKLTGDGSQNGVFQNNVSIESTTPIFGTQSSLFEIPDPIPSVNPPFSTFEVGDSTSLGEDFTLSLHVDNQEAELGFTRLITSYRGTGPVSADRILLDYDPTGGVITGIRAIVNNTVVGTGAPPAGITDPGYHHYAVTVDSGDVKVYFDGSEVASGNVGLGYTNTFNLYVGEDPHDGGGTANEQLIGNVDDVLVINRALSGADILGLSTQAASSVVTPVADEYAAYYDFEGDAGTTITDKFVVDGANNGMAHQNAFINGNPQFGSNSGGLDAAVAPPGSPYSRIEVGEVGNLGSQFTMSASFIQTQPGYSGEGITRLFSTFSGGGGTADRLILDFNHEADVADIGIRLILPDGTVVVAPDTFSLGEKHTITATYDNGDVRLYLDGAEVASGTGAGGDIDLGAFPLYIGEDAAGAINESFIGILDQALILESALSANQVKALHNTGRIPEPSTLALLAAAALAAVGLRRRI